MNVILTMVRIFICKKKSQGPDIEIMWLQIYFCEKIDKEEEEW